MRSTVQIISGFLLLCGVGVSGVWLFMSLAGKGQSAAAWDAVTLVGLPIAAVGAAGGLASGLFKSSISHLAML